MHELIIEFWFHEIEPKQWWVKDKSFDQMILERFGKWHAQAKAGELASWRETPLGSLAEIIILDQFSRNMYRDTSDAFAWDPMALALAQFAIEKGFDQQLAGMHRAFLFMPFMHSESPSIHEQALTLFEALGIESSLDFERQHKAIIDRFGRYPHRNIILGRASTDEELAFFEQPGSGF